MEKTAMNTHNKKGKIYRRNFAVPSLFIENSVEGKSMANLAQ